MSRSAADERKPQSAYKHNALLIHAALTLPMDQVNPHLDLSGSAVKLAKRVLESLWRVAEAPHLLYCNPILAR